MYRVTDTTTSRTSDPVRYKSPSFASHWHSDHSDVRKTLILPRTIIRSSEMLIFLRHPLTGIEDGFNVQNR
jgi:hypothetical protein